ncbi:MAG: hypothetical protein HFJ45_09300 [Clostridia bacterium]|nr:hypothetical protein [Clostridia bacterium]
MDTEALNNKKDTLRKENLNLLQTLNQPNLSTSDIEQIKNYLNKGIYSESLETLDITTNTQDRIMLTQLASMLSEINEIPNNAI